MAYPSSYTELALKTYMHTVLADVATVLGWGITTHYGEAVNEAVATYGVADVTTITGLTNLYKLRALARREAWRAACGALAAKFDFSADGHAVKRSDLYNHAAAELQRAENDALPFDTTSGYNVGTASVEYADDWYEPPETNTDSF